MSNEIDIVEALDGMVPARVKMGLDYRCDQCLSDIEPGDHITMYASDWNYRDEDRPMRWSRAYCPDCDRAGPVLPMEGAEEKMVSVLVGEGYEFTEPRLIFHSTADEGVPWDPEHIFSVFMGVPLEDFAREQEDGDITPGAVADIIIAADIDISEILDEDGTLRVTDEELKEMMGNVEEKRKEIVEEAKEKL